MKLLLAFTIIPLVELALLIKLSAATSLPATIALVIVTGVIGSYLARWQGTQAWFRFQKALSEGRVPGPEVQDGLLIFFAAGLLLTPGLLTDIFGFCLLAPPTRAIVRGHLSNRFKGKFKVHASEFGAQPTQSFDGDTVEAENVRAVDEQDASE